MKRSEIKRKSPMKAKNATLKQGVRLPAQSSTRKAQEPARRKVIAETRERAGGRCEALDLLPEVACWGPLDTHERLTRARSGGTSQLDASLTTLVCRGHHDHIGRNITEAESLGLLLPSKPSAKSRLLTELEDA